MSTHDALGVELTVLRTAQIPMPLSYVFRPERGRVLGLVGMLSPGGDSLLAPCLAYVVRHPSAGTILVDSGFHADASSDARREFGPLMSVVFRGLRPDPQPFDEQLRAAGVEPDEVELTVMTHLHADHTSAMRLLPRTEFVCARAEWEAAHERAAMRNGYVSHHLPREERMRLLEPESDGEAYASFERSIDLLGDGSVRLLSTPGHTKGHMSVLVRLAGGRDVLLAGDAAYTLRSIDEQRLPLFTAGDGAYRRSLRALKEFAEASPDALIVPTHDPDAWQSLRDAATAASGAA